MSLAEAMGYGSSPGVGSTDRVREAVRCDGGHSNLSSAGAPCRVRVTPSVVHRATPLRLGSGTLARVDGVITSSAPRRRTLPTFLAAAAVALAALLIPAAPASAHDELVSSDPSADAVLDALPPQITLTYSADILDADGATVIQVTDAAGTALTDGAATVSGTVVTQALAGPASGVVTVVWRVVSGDGHPIDGTFSFTVPAAPTPTATPTPTETPSATSTPEPTVTVTATPAPAESTSDASPLPWILLAVAAVLVVGALVWVALARGRGGSSGSGSAGSAGR